MNFNISTLVYYKSLKKLTTSCTPRPKATLRRLDGFLQGQYFSSLSINHVAINRVFSHDVTEAILVSQNNETAAILVSQASPVGVELFSYVNAFFCSNKFA